MPDRGFRSYEEFFAFYIQQHSNPTNRLLHASGTLLGLATIVAALALRRPRWALLALPVAYGCAWAGHFAFEKNRPATFGHPVWSLVSDFHMLALMAAGRMQDGLPRQSSEPSTRAAVGG